MNNLSEIDYTKELTLIIEAILLATDRTMTISELLTIFPPEHRPEQTQIQHAITQLIQQNPDRGIELITTANGYQFRTKPKYINIISRLWEEKPPKYSRALLETLAIIAYRQPITRGEIEQIRGVSINQSIFKTLQEERNWIRVIGYKEIPGKPGLYATTKDFLSYFGLEKLEQLPPLPKIMELLEHTTASSG